MEVAPRAVKSLKSAMRVFLSDLEALPDAAFTKSFGDATRTVADIVYEVNLVNDHIGMTIRREEPFAWPEGDWIVAPEGFNSKQMIIQAFSESMTRIVETVETFSEAEMESKVTTEHGETDIFERCQFMALHMWYHSGQLNYIQTLLGDSKWHW